MTRRRPACKFVGALLLLVMACSVIHATTYTYTIGPTKKFQLDTAFGIPIMSNSFTFMGAPCDGQDVVSRWSQIVPIIPFGTVINDWRVRPWQAKGIMVRTFVLTKLSGGPHLWMMVGNNYTPDAMISLGAGVNSDIFPVPDGTGFYFPGTDNDPGDAYFDLHGSCSGGGTASYRLDVVYALTPDESPPPPPPPAGDGPIFTATLGADSGNFTGYTLVQRFEAAALTAPPNAPTRLDAWLRAGASGLNVIAASACHAQPTGVSCADAPVALTPPSAIAGVGTGKATGSFAWDRTSPVIVAFAISDPSANTMRFSQSATGTQNYWKAAANDTMTQAKTGYTMAGAPLLGIEKLITNGF